MDRGKSRHSEGNVDFRTLKQKSASLENLAESCDFNPTEFNSFALTMKQNLNGMSAPLWLTQEHLRGLQRRACIYILFFIISRYLYKMSTFYFGIFTIFRRLYTFSTIMTKQNVE